MTMIVSSVAAAILASTSPAMGGAAMPFLDPVQHRRGDQDEALAARRAGDILPLREIERRVIPSMRGAQYIGFSFESASAVYTLKFLREGKVIWVMVDARSGAVIGRAGG